ncbi:MAG: CoB--CoM heterodisulfide reductase iron-sulfur subunit A family protein [Planctomycetes bacterium]|nr:CoB--CoM heterodisulfide reductase iron-sulfur subunit A family protein [Planctomycetota bacterium]
MTDGQIGNTKNKPQPDGQAPRIGVYICHCGGNISDVVTVQKVVEAAARFPNVVVARDNTFMCSDPGQALIARDIHDEKLDRVVVAACSPSLHEHTFRRTLARARLNSYLYEHANIREQVSWCSKSDPKGATDKAIRLVAAAVAKARLLEPLEPMHVEAKQHVAVIGGGVSGLRSARDLSRNGLAVTLLERSAFLGGRMTQLDRVYPTEDGARELLRQLLEEVSVDPNIDVYTGAEVTAASGYVGNFHLSVRLDPPGVTKKLSPDQVRAVMEACPETTQSEFEHRLVRRKAIHLPYAGCYPDMPAIDWGTCTRCGKCVEVLGGEGITLDAQPEQLDLDVGAIVLATGFDLYEPRQGEHGYGEHAEVITLAQLIRLADKEGPTGGRLEHNGRSVKNVCLIHCVGSRQVEGLHEPGPDGRINDYCSRVCCTAALHAANEIRERFPEISVFDFYQDIRTYGRGHEDYYENASKRGVLFFRYLPETPPVVTAANRPNGCPLVVRVKDTLTFGEELEVPADLVVLATGMVPRDISDLVKMLKLPRSADRFLQEVHPKLRPVELAVNGVFIAGACQAPMDITESCAAASAAAVKAAALLGKGYIELDPFVAEVDPQLCVADGKCLEECKYMTAVSLVEEEVRGETKRFAVVNAALCGGCGMCAAVCPEGAIQVAGWRLDQFEAMTDALVADYA